MSGSIGIVSVKVRKKEEGRRKKEEGRGKREEGRRLKSLKKPKFPVDIYPWFYTNDKVRT
ncbi:MULTISPECIES: hypothetical protein [unclassified Okeania]|uniref:hypothetical protein n=1 Tax=unclassified Okeania TaxID=2634635 RepID=UPI0013BD2265|nr:MULTISPECIES: hypothetical protein [unclassified Okeania]NET13530.1 hypothetical protein [Okeania sp. SIO1H6]NET20935.1 hypothetical protein [Okeania sp. SIO1H5]NET95897.1 hypothetical protein [Okeania sp. SIO1H2]